MPLYDYCCTECGEITEVFLSMSGSKQEIESECPKCEKETKMEKRVTDVRAIGFEKKLSNTEAFKDRLRQMRDSPGVKGTIGEKNLNKHLPN